MVEQLVGRLSGNINSQLIMVVLVLVIVVAQVVHSRATMNRARSIHLDLNF